MDRLIHTALSTLRISSHGDTIHANNLAQASVPGFRRDLETVSQVKFLEGSDQLRSRAFTIREPGNAFSPDSGEIRHTQVSTDVAINGDGYFIIQREDRVPELSRRGDLRVNPENQLVDGANALMLDNNLQPITLPQFRDIAIGEDGRITITPIGGEPGETVEAGFLGTTLAEGAALGKSEDGGIRLADGTLPVADQRSQILNGALETSNVNPVEELVDTLKRQREYELNVKLISIARDLDEAGASIMRMPN